MCFKTMSMDVSPYTFDGLRSVDYMVKVDDDKKVVAVMLDRYFLNSLKYDCEKKVRKEFNNYDVVFQEGI